MDPNDILHRDISHNSLEVHNGKVNAHYGDHHGDNNYMSPATEPSSEQVTKWILGSEPVLSQQSFQNSLQKKRTEDSCLWFLEGEEFRSWESHKWESQPRSFLWLHGKSGCGKTILCSSAINRLRSVCERSTGDDSVLLYHFFTMTDSQSQTSGALVQNLVYQLAGYNNTMRTRAKELYKLAGEGYQPADHDRLFEGLMRVPKRIYIVIDALDECTEQLEVCEVIKKLCKQENHDIRILASTNTTQSFHMEKTLLDLYTHKIDVTPKFINEDIEDHIRKLDLSRWDDDNLKDKIIRHITANCDGSFRWAIGMLIEIERCNDEEELEEVFGSPPRNLSETYERILSGIQDPSSIEKLRVLLCWLLYAARPLRIEEIQHAVAIKADDQKFEPKRYLRPGAKFLEQCKFLVSDDEDSDMFALDDDIASNESTWRKKAVLRLEHSSVLEFFQNRTELSSHAKKFSTERSEGNLILAISSLTYILYVNSMGISEDTTSHYPLFEYTIQHWYSHAREAGSPASEKLSNLIQGVLNTNWYVYRLVTYPNISTKYDPWPAPQASTLDNRGIMSQSNDLCKTCRKIRYSVIQDRSGFKHMTYADLVVSARDCKLCKMIHHALLQFGIARVCQQSAKRLLDEEDAAKLSLEVDGEIRSNAGSREIQLRMETEDPFLLISCYCYFGRLHLFTNSDSLLANSIPGRIIHLDTRDTGLLDTCAHWLQECEESHSECSEQGSLPFLPSMVIDISSNPARLLSIQSGQRGRYVTATCSLGTSRTWLSYLRTTSTAVVEFMIALPLDQINAITISRHLGIRYLWIDWLCINNDEDMLTAELLRIPNYFANSTLNIVVTGKSLETGIFTPRLSPLFLPVLISESEELFIGWLGTESYCDPRGLNVLRYPDGWKYETPLYQRTWAMQEIRLARRNLVLQSEGERPLHPSAPSQWFSSQLYMQCQREVRWESGRRRQREADNSMDWYELVEDNSGRALNYEPDRLIAILAVAMSYSRTLGGKYGQYMTGLWTGDFFRGLLWRADDTGNFPNSLSYGRKCYIAPSWSWVSNSTKVKYMWPLNANVSARILDSDVQGVSLGGTEIVRGNYIVIRSTLLRLERVNSTLTPWTDDVSVKICGRPGQIRIRYFLDHGDSEDADLYALKITRRVALILKDAHDDTDSMDTSSESTARLMVRVGLMIVAKPDTKSWAEVSEEQVVKII